MLVLRQPQGFGFRYTNLFSWSGRRYTLRSRRCQGFRPEQL